MDQPYDDNEALPLPLTGEEVSKAIFLGARQGRSGCHDYVDMEDLIQVCWVDLLEKPHKYSRYETQGNFNGLVKEFTRTSGAFAQREKAITLGYQLEDLFFYSKKVLREVIPAVLESKTTGERFEFEYPDRALWVDVEKALDGLSQADLQIVHWAFYGDPDEAAGALLVASKLGITEGAAAMRISRLLDKIRMTLGGENPAPRRKSLSNAASQAVTRNQWDGEG